MLLVSVDKQEFMSLGLLDIPMLGGKNIKMFI